MKSGEVTESAEGGFVITLHSCPGKSFTRPVTGNEGGILGLGLMADLEYVNDPANQEKMAYQTLCDDGCEGPIKVPRKILGVQVGEKEVCPRGYNRQPGKGSGITIR